MVFWILLFLGLLSVIYKCVFEAIDVTKSRKKQKTNEEKNIVSINYEMIYREKQLLTKNELNNFRKLKYAADKKGYLICPKVRLLDLVEPKQYQKKYKTYLYKIQSKHVDFVICDQNMNVKVIIELDDASHLRKDRIERDQFVNQVLCDVGYKIIHTWKIEENILDEF